MKKIIFFTIAVLLIAFTACSNLADNTGSISDSFATLSDREKTATVQSVTILSELDTEIIENADTLSQGDTISIKLDDKTLTCKVVSNIPASTATNIGMFLSVASTTSARTIVLEVNDGTTITKTVTIKIYEDNSRSIDGKLSVTTKDSEGKETTKEVQYSNINVDKDGSLISGEIAIDDNKVELDSVNTLKKLNKLAGSIDSEYVNNSNQFDYTVNLKTRINNKEWQTFDNYTDYYSYILSEFTTLQQSGATELSTDLKTTVTLNAKDSVDYTFDMTGESESSIIVKNGKVTANAIITMNFNASKDGITATGKDIKGKLYYSLSSPSNIGNLSAIAIRWTGTMTVNGKEIQFNNMPFAAFNFVEKL